MSRESFLNTYTKTAARAARAGVDFEYRRKRRVDDSYPELCSPEYYKALDALVSDGEYWDQASLDEETSTLMEQIRRHGAVVGNGGRAFLLEELDFWSAPFGIEPGVTRRLGTGIVSPTSKEERRVLREQAERVRQARLRMLRAEMEAEKAVANEALAREQAIWDLEQERLEAERRERLKNARRADVEWEKAAGTPHKRKQQLDEPGRHYRVDPRPKIPRQGRFYVPEWKRHELRAKAAKDFAAQAAIGAGHRGHAAVAAAQAREIERMQKQAELEALQAQRREAKDSPIEFIADHAWTSVPMTGDVKTLDTVSPAEIDTLAFQMDKLLTSNRCFWPWDEIARAMKCDRELVMYIAGILCNKGRLVRAFK